jgi:hypothetical protein
MDRGVAVSIDAVGRTYLVPNGFIGLLGIRFAPGVGLMGAFGASLPALSPTRAIYQMLR